MSDKAWADYLAAAQELDAVRRRTAAAVVEQAAAAQAAREELARVRAQLFQQRAKLHELGVPEDALAPTPGETVAADPTAILAALRQAGSMAGAAEAALTAGRRTGPVWQRNLLVYGPLAAVVLVVQLVLYATVDADALPIYAPLCGLIMPLAAFGLGWLVIGLVFPPGPDGRVDRTAPLGALVCLAPVLVTCMGLGALRLFQ